MDNVATIEKYKKLLSKAEKESFMLEGKLEETNSQLIEACGSADDGVINNKVEELRKEKDTLNTKLEHIMKQLESLKWE